MIENRPVRADELFTVEIGSTRIATLDLILRFAAIGPLLLLAALLLRSYPRLPVGWLGALYILGVVCYLLCPLVVGDWDFGPWAIPFLAGCYSVAAFFWLFTRALFVDGFKFRLVYLTPVLVLVAVGFLHRSFANGLAAEDTAAAAILLVVPQILSLGFIVLSLAQAQLGRSGDLIEPRRLFRDVLTGVSGAYMVAVVVTEILLEGRSRIHELEVLNAGLIFAIAMIACWFALQVRPGFFAPEQRPQPVPTTPENPDTELLTTLLSAMENERAYLQEGLTIAGLAKQLGTQEYLLRRVINGQLGHRNFNAFLNHYRIAEACNRLRDAEYARQPVLTIAMDLGYRSLGPFNRAFREETGMTPTEYRRAPEQPESMSKGE